MNFELAQFGELAVRSLPSFSLSPNDQLRPFKLFSFSFHLLLSITIIIRPYLLPSTQARSILNLSPPSSSFPRSAHVRRLVFHSSSSLPALASSRSQIRSVFLSLSSHLVSKTERLTRSRSLAGQSFRWTATPLASPSSPPSAPTEYSLCLSDRLLLLRQSPTHLHYSAVFPPPTQGEATEEKAKETERFVRDYLRLDVDLEELYRTWGEKDAVFRKEEGDGGVLEGVAVLRQDPWECLFS